MIIDQCGKYVIVRNEYYLDANGSRKKKIGSFSSKYFLTIGNFTSKSCIVDTDEDSYQYIYSTKKKKKIRLL